MDTDFRTFEEEVATACGCSIHRGIARNRDCKMEHYTSYHKGKCGISLNIYADPEYKLFYTAEMYHIALDMWLILEYSHKNYTLQENLPDGDIVYHIDGSDSFVNISNKIKELFHIK